MRQTIPLLACVALAALAGCGDRDGSGSGGSALTFERLADTSGLSRGAAIAESLEVFRMPGGSLRVRARLRLPEGTRVQVAVRPGAGGSTLAMTQAVVQGGVLESPPMMAESGPLPVARYRFEMTAQFSRAWQPREVLLSTDDGKSLRGPGITRTRVGGAVFLLAEEMTR
jgi:hypothetical protein